MTSRQIWEGMLTELSKVNAPSMLLQDFNYFLNKAIYQYINKRYNIYDINQETTDSLRVLKASSYLNATQVSLTDMKDWGAGSSRLFGATYEVGLPQDYFHILNCVCIYQLKKNWKCFNQNDYVQFGAKRLTADSWSVIINDYFNRPLPERPYYYIHNININSAEVPTNPLTEENQYGTDIYDKYGTKKPSKSENMEVEEGGESKAAENGESKAETVSNFPRTRTIKLSGKDATLDLVEKETAFRYGNPAAVRMEIRYGSNDVFDLKKVAVDYLKAPQTIRLTQEQVNLTEDTSQIMEFPDYVCQEIINELTTLVMEQVADPRLQTHTIVSQSIANPAVQQQTQQAAQA